MNERIRELANKAGYYVDPDFDIEFEVFAELIVRDRIDLANKYAAGGAGSEFDVGYIACATTLAEEFAKHFNNKQRSQDEDN